MAYPVAFQSDHVERQSRLTTFFRLIVAIPWFIVAYFWELVGFVGVVIAWFAVVITGRYPAFAYEWVSMALRYRTRILGWSYLMTDAWPPFDGGEHPEYPIRLVIPQPLEPYSRWKALLRLILAIPVYIMAWLFGILAEIVAIISWVVIVITGKLPTGLFDVQRLAMAYTALAGVYVSLITETYPPISPEDDGAVAVPASPPPPYGG
ncbi:MAG TPA: DUF4389 domain-containing protein [Conexibacter sp.]|jgi:hypothetical protein